MISIPYTLQVNNLICIEKFSDVPQLGRFTLRTEGDRFKFTYFYEFIEANLYHHNLVVRSIIFLFSGKTVAVGKVTDIPAASN